MKHFFVIGDRTSQSLSPLIFNHWFRLHNIDAKYSFIEVNKNNFENTLLEKINDKKTFGFNVTIPFKKDIFKHVNLKNIHAKNIGAINCVNTYKTNKGINTDWIGYLNSIKELKIKKSENIIILGYGGASKAIVYGLFYKGFRNIFVFNRTKKLIKFKENKFFTKNYNIVGNYLNNVSLIINTTPINPLNKQQILKVNKNAVISDIVYKPKNTAFLNNFKKNKKIYGISMLVEQAIPCFYNWFGFNPKVDQKLIQKLNAKIKQ